MNPFWGETLLAGMITSAAALLTWIFLDASWALALLLLGLLGFVLYQQLQASRLLRWVEQPAGTPLPTSRGAWEILIAMLHRRARQALEERQRISTDLERFRRAGEALPDGVVILDAEFCIEWLNITAAQHLGLNPAQDIRSPIRNLLREPGFVTYLEHGQYADPLVLHPLRNPGSTLALQIVPYGAAQKLLLTRDISQLDKLETMRRDFVANVSHELKTPLTVVSGFIETVLDGLPELTVEETRDYLTLASEQAQRMQHLIEDLLTLSALETGSPPPAEELVPLADLLAEIASEARALSAGRHQIELAEPPTVHLLGSRKELRSAFGNLLSNAVRYTPEHGHVRIFWRAHADGGGCLTVEDDGPGIDSQHIPRLTERFYRVDRGRSREAGGTGLGLAIVKHVLTRHQATLEIASQPGQGSRFSACFPAQRISH